IAIGGCGAHARESCEPLVNGLVELSVQLGLIPRHAGRNPECDQMVGREAYVDVLQVVQSAYKQACSEEQQQAQSHLHSDKATAQAKLPAARSCELLFQRLDQIGTPELQRRRQTEEQSNRNRDSEVEQQDSKIEPRREWNLAYRVGEQLV